MSKLNKTHVKHAKKHRKKNKHTKIKPVKTSDVNNVVVKNDSSNNVNDNDWYFGVTILLIFIIALLMLASNRSDEDVNYKQRPVDSKDEDFLSDFLMRQLKSRRDYYNDVYLKSDAWKRKRYVVLRRDNWRCVYCGGYATQVHHKKYAKKNIGKEPIEWLVSVCKPCHDAQHH